jgi:hypothetical protein
MSRTKDLTNQTFGRWTVLHRVDNAPDGTAQWQCRCSCGTERVVKAKRLLGGSSESCGCLRNDIDSATKVKDLLGRRFGSWEVLRFDGVKGGKAHWLCRCACGATRSVNGANLTRGVSRSCGSCSR